jgi:DNA-directed RNA polymerase specialized sigma subunit
LEQVAWFKAHQKFQEWDPARNDHFQGFAYNAVAGAVKMSIRRRAWFEANEIQPMACFSAGFEHTAQSILSTKRTPEDQQIDQETQRSVMEHLDKLPEIAKSVMVALYVNGSFVPKDQIETMRTPSARAAAERESTQAMQDASRELNLSPQVIEEIRKSAMDLLRTAYDIPPSEWGNDSTGQVWLFEPQEMK